MFQHYPLFPPPPSSSLLLCSYQFQWLSFHFCIYWIWWHFVHFALKLHTHMLRLARTCLILIICVQTNFMSLVFCLRCLFVLSFVFDWIVKHLSAHELLHTYKMENGSEHKEGATWSGINSHWHIMMCKWLCRRFHSFNLFLCFCFRFLSLSLALFCQASAYQHRKYHHTRLTCQ